MIDLPGELLRRLVDPRPAPEDMQGGQGWLYLATWNDPGRADHDKQVVIKKLRRPRSTRSTIWKFWRASRSSGIVRLIYAARHGEHDYEVTQFHRAGSLDDYTRANPGRMPEQQARSVLWQLTETLAYLSSEGIQHGDLKPANILVGRAEPLQLLLVDFGISEPVEGTREAGPRWEGSYRYVAPERRKGLVTPKNDWWSLGMIMLELLLGHYPFEQPRSTSDPNADIRFLEQLGDRLEREDIEAAQFIRDIPQFDGRWINLIDGLLTKEHSQRWNERQVREWSSNQDPPVIRISRGDWPEGFVFDGQRCDTPEKLAILMQANWLHAGALLSSMRVTDLAEWIASLETRGRMQPGSGRRLRQLGDLRPVDLAITLAITILHRRADAMFQGYRLDEPFPRTYWRNGVAPRECWGLVVLARRAVLVERDAEAADPEALHAVAALWSSRSLRDMCGSASEHLAEVDREWRRAHAEAVDALVLIPPAYRPKLSNRELIASLLLAVVDPKYVPWLAEQLARQRKLVGRRQRADWFRTLAERATRPDSRDYRPEASAYYVLLSACDGNQPDGPVEVSDDDMTEARARLDGRHATMLPLPAPLVRLVRRTLRFGVGLAALYATLVVFAGVGVGVATSPLQGVWSSAFLAVLGLVNLAGHRLAGTRLTRALRGGWLGGVLGFPLAGSAGSLAAIAGGPGAGWPMFWVGWMLAVIAGTAMGAAR